MTQRDAGTRAGLTLTLALVAATLALAVSAARAPAQTAPADGALVYEAESLQETKDATASLRAQGTAAALSGRATRSSCSGRRR